MSQSPLQIVRAMEAALQRRDVDVSAYFHDDFTWTANTGCGVKRGLQEFERNWYAPFRDVFRDRDFVTDHWMEDGEWAACFGNCHCTHGATFMGIAPTGKRIVLPYIDFWRIADGKIAENKVSVDFACVLAQLGRDVFDGHGWEAFDDGRRTPAAPPEGV